VVVGLVGILAQVGCLTLTVIFIALLAGLWLDGRFLTRPLFTVGLVVLSIPLTLFLMYRIVMRSASRIQELTIGDAEKQDSPEEPSRGDNRTDED